MTGPKLALARQEGVTSLRKEMVATVGRQEMATTTVGRQEIIARGGKRQEVLASAGAGAPRQEVVTAPRQVFTQDSMNEKYLDKKMQMNIGRCSTPQATDRQAKPSTLWSTQATARFAKSPFKKPLKTHLKMLYSICPVKTCQPKRC